MSDELTFNVSTNIDLSDGSVVQGGDFTYIPPANDDAPHQFKAEEGDTFSSDNEGWEYEAFRRLAYYFLSQMSRSSLGDYPDLMGLRLIPPSYTAYAQRGAALRYLTVSPHVEVSEGLSCLERYIRFAVAKDNKNLPGSGVGTVEFFGNLSLYEAESFALGILEQVRITRNLK